MRPLIETNFLRWLFLRKISPLKMCRDFAPDVAFLGGTSCASFGVDFEVSGFLLSFWRLQS